MNVSILIGTFGDQRWADLAWSHAYPSAAEQGAAEVQVLHLNGGTLAEVRNQLVHQTFTEPEWLCFLDADDTLSPGYLDAMKEAMPVDPIPTTVSSAVEPTVTSGNPEPRSDTGPLTALLVPAVQYVDRGVDRGEPLIPAWGKPLIDVNCAVIGTLISRDLFLEVGGFRERLANGELLTALEDWDLWLRAVLAGARLVPVPAAVYRATVRSDGRNRDQSLYRAIRAEHEAAWHARAAA